METRVLTTADLSARERYQLLVSLVVPRPIAWVSTFSAAGAANLAPFSYYMAVSPTPLLIAVSIGHRQGAPKDSLRNVRETRAFCVNVVTEQHLEAMNASSGEYGPEIDEFAHAGLAMATAESVHAPYVADAPAVLECHLYRDVDLGDAANGLIIGEVRRVRVQADLLKLEGRLTVDSEALKPVARLAGEDYSKLGEIVRLARPENINRPK